MTALALTHLTTAAGAAAVAIVAFTRGGRTALMARVLIAALTVSAWNAAHGMLLITWDPTWRILAPSLGPLPIAAFTLLALKVGWPTLPPRRLWPGMVVAAALSYSLLTLSALWLPGPRDFVLSSHWNLGFTGLALPCLFLIVLSLARGARRGAPEQRKLSGILMLAGAMGFAGGLSEVLPPDKPLNLGALAMLGAVVLASVGLARRGELAQSLALKEVLVALGAVAVVVVSATLVVARAPAQPELTAVALIAVALVGFTTYGAARRRWQLRLEEATRLATIGKATSVLAHEVRNPLTTVQGAVDILEQELADQPGHAAAPYLQMVRGELERVLSLVDDCLTYARAPEPTQERFDLQRLLEQVVERARLRFPDNPIVIQGEIGGPLEVHGDSSMLTRLVENLVVNACQAREGGAVQLELVEASPVQLRLAVIDQGPGVAEEHRLQVFEPFFTTKARGGGLGLAIVREIARRHGGDVAVSAAVGGGARFEVWWSRQLPIGSGQEEA